MYPIHSQQELSEGRHNFIGQTKHSAVYLSGSISLIQPVHSKIEVFFSRRKHIFHRICDSFTSIIRGLC